MSSTEPARYVLFLHGAAGSPLSWEEQVAKLPPELPARAPWLRGLRPGSTEPFGVADAAADLLLDLQLDGVERAAVVGHSLGALVALQCAIERPDAVSHLVLIAGQVRPPRTLLALQRQVLRLVPRRRLAASGVSKDRLLEALDSGGAFDASGRLADVAAPTLVLCGSRDRPNLPAARALAAGIPHARLHVLDGVGHDAMRERPAELNAVLYAFLGHTPRGQ